MSIGNDRAGHRRPDMHVRGENGKFGTVKVPLESFRPHVNVVFICAHSQDSVPGPSSMTHSLIVPKPAVAAQANKSRHYRPLYRLVSFQEYSV